MFQRLCIKGWRQFLDIDIEFHRHLTVLTGANGAGKTTILNLVSQSTGWTTEFVSSYKQEKTGRARYFNSILEKWEKLFDGQPETNNDRNYTKIGEIRYSDGVLSDIVVPTDVNTGTYQAQLKNMHLEKGVFIDSHRPIFPYRPVNTIPTEIVTRKQIFDRYNSFKIAYIKDMYRDVTRVSSTALIKETLASLATFGYGNSKVLPVESAKNLFEGYIEILKKVLPPKLGFEDIKVMVPEVMLYTKTGNFPFDAVSGGISSIIDITWQLYMLADPKDSFVAIIDEPENHLHPELQKSFLGNLILAFPNAQFIVATHNPFMITAQKDANVYVLDYNEGHQVCSTKLDYINRAGTSNEILRNVLGIESTIPYWAEETLNSIIEKYSKMELNSTTLAGLKKELASVGLNNYIPESIAQIIEGSDYNDKNK